MTLLDILDVLLDDDIAVIKAETRQSPSKLYKEMSDEELRAASRPQIRDVIFNPPATIVKWSDGTKTIVKCGEGDKFDKEKGLALAIAKKYYGSAEGWYRKKLTPWLEKKEEKKKKKEYTVKTNFDMDEIKKRLGLSF